MDQNRLKMNKLTPDMRIDQKLTIIEVKLAEKYKNWYIKHILAFVKTFQHIFCNSFPHGGLEISHIFS